MPIIAKNIYAIQEMLLMFFKWSSESRDWHFKVVIVPWNVRIFRIPGNKDHFAIIQKIVGK